MSNQQSPRCPRCGNRLFQERELLSGRFFYFWECSLGCSRRFDELGRERSYQVGKRRVRVVRELVPVR